ncbi:MAG TPA: delta 1-pyrroline-5-carboxylate synthetase, partial [Methylophaga sp.]|nr:delta 1-pyrroline-5-carboxylate synthetase [Methylophaga sp.]
MYVVKLGGSLYHTAELKSWLTLLEQTALNESVVIVPGGGPFADMVRQAQQLHKFDDQHAHHMAILAMAQYGLML